MMAPPSSSLPPPHRLHDQALAMLSIVERVATAPEFHVDPERALARFEEGLAQTDPNQDKLDVLMAAGPTLGISWTSVYRTPQEIVRTGSQLLPALALSTQAPASILAVLGTRGRAARVLLEASQQGPTWLNALELASALGVSDDETPVRVLTCTPAMPLATSSSSASGHLAHDAHPPSAMSPIARLRALLRLERADLSVIAIYAIAVGVLALATPLAVQALVNNVSFSTALQPVAVLSAVVVIALGLAGLLRVLQLYVVENLQRRTMLRVISDLSYRLPRVRMEAFDSTDGRKLVNRFFDVLTVQKASSTLLIDGLALFLELSVGLLVLSFYSPLLLALSLIIWAALGFVIFGLGRRAPATSIEESHVKHEAAGWLEELAQHPTVFKSEAGRDLARSRADALARDYLGARRAHFTILLRQNVGAFVLQAVASAALLGVGGFLVIDRQLTLGQLVASELILSAVIASLTKLGKQLETFYDLVAAMDKLGHLLDLPLEREGGENLPKRETPAALEVHDLVFTFAGDAPALAVPHLRVAPGEHIAVLGGGASGKTTFMDLLLGLRTPKQGRIEVDGLDLRDLSLASLRGQVAVVRGVEIFEGSIADNVRMGRPWIRLSEVRQALAAVGLLDEVARLPRGVHTRLLSSGAPLSSGQAMRLMLAQAIVGRPRLLLLDEVLDLVEPVYRTRIADELFRDQAPWTLVLTTDNASTAHLCPRVMHLPQGRVEASPLSPRRGGQAGGDR